MSDPASEKNVQVLARVLFTEQRTRAFAETDRLLAALLGAEWVFGIVLALLVSPRTWTGFASAPHLHVYAATILGGVIVALPIALAVREPGAWLTRHAIAVAQMLMSALLIHLTGGRIETHFHIFGSLALLAMYRDWSVLVPATCVIIADHALRGVLWPQSVYGVLTASPWRTLEHAAWIAFEDTFLINACIRGAREMRQIAHRQAQVELAYAGVEHRVVERTAELDESRRRAEAQSAQLHEQATELAIARDAALESSRVKTEFLANMSHELRTPMNGVIGMTSVLLETPLSSEQRECAETVASSAEALLVVINDILDFSKLETGRVQLEAVEFDPRVLIEDVTTLLAGSVQDDSLEVGCRVPPSVPSALVGDPSRIRQVLTHLLGNAIKFTADGEVFASLEVLDEDDSTARLRLSVRDTGVGIPAERCEAIFESFTQADGSMTRRHGGVGLGLSISRRLVRLMNGEISVTSAPGRGSTFRVDLPLRKPAPRPAEPVMDSTLVGRRVLVVDDNASSRLVLAEMLAAWGSRPWPVGGGADALDALRTAPARDPFALVVLDAQMPDMNGVQVAAAIAADPLLGEPPVVLLTALRTVHQDPVPGVAAVLGKPIRQDALLGVLERVLADHGRAARSTATPAEASGVGELRVLLADDDPVNRRIAQRILERLGCVVEAVADGHAAVAAAERGRYDLILMDVQMPSMGGFAATEEIRRRGIRTPVIAMTAHALQDDRERCLAAGMNDHVAKPINIEVLAETLTKWGRTLDAPSLAPDQGWPLQEGVN